MSLRIIIEMATHDGEQISHTQLVERVTRAVRDVLVVTKREKAFANAEFDDLCLYGAGAEDYIIDFSCLDGSAAPRVGRRWTGNWVSDTTPEEVESDEPDAHWNLIGLGRREIDFGEDQ